MTPCSLFSLLLLAAGYKKSQPVSTALLLKLLLVPDVFGGQVLNEVQRKVSSCLDSSDWACER